ncbi:MAG: isochorismatase family protein [Sedimentisphaerales bacterium]|nr:isochorismatase family protein [Sedimentisphaerales bacterium]
MLDIEDCCLVVVDVQGKLARLMYDKQVLFQNIKVLIETAKILEIPILWCQQVPDALGPTLPEIAELLSGNEPIDKSAFSCCGAEQFNVKLNELNRQQVILCGIETHVCIYQTAVDLLRKGFKVDLIADAVSSRAVENKQTGINRIAAEGANISCIEMALFELLRTAEHPKFRQIAKLIK